MLWCFLFICLFADVYSYIQPKFLSSLHNAPSKAFRCMPVISCQLPNMLLAGSKVMSHYGWTGACDPHAEASTPLLSSRQAACSKHVADSAVEWNEFQDSEANCIRWNKLVKAARTSTTLYKQNGGSGRSAGRLAPTRSPRCICGTSGIYVNAGNGGDKAHSGSGCILNPSCFRSDALGTLLSI
jgi:hypothetical protein